MSEETAPHINESEKWILGDITLIAADRVSFRVPSRALFTASEMFAEVIELGGIKLLEFYDPELESAGTIERFLDLAFNSHLAPECVSEHPTTAEVELTRELLALVRFLQKYCRKYECWGLFRQLRMCAVEHVKNKQLSAHTAFVVGAVAEEVDLCAAALQHACTIDADWRLNRHSAMRYWICAADPGSVERSLWDLIPAAYAWAWSQAWAHGMGAVEHRHSRQHDLSRVIPEFRKAVKETERSSKVENTPMHLVKRTLWSSCGLPQATRITHAAHQRAECNASPGRMKRYLWLRLPTFYAWAWAEAWESGGGIGDHMRDQKHQLKQVTSRFRENVRDKVKA